jgi:succinate dehydrogenase flavin-adding protein (antitoxin of CptAB toxin-antitoxin module)
MTRELAIGHVNVFHLDSKLPDVVTLLNHHHLHILGVTESRLSPLKHCSDFLRLPHYSFIRKDANMPGHTGIGVYIHQTISSNIIRRYDLESSFVEAIWLELRSTNFTPALIGFIYRNPASLISWNDRYIEMIDKVNQCNLTSFILGDFNINLLGEQPQWENITSLLGYDQLITEPTRISNRSSTLIDHIYCNNQKINIQCFTSDIALSDHKPVICKWSFKLPKPIPKGHTYINYRNFKHFNLTSYSADLSSLNFENVFKCTDPDEAANLFVKSLLYVINKHAPVCKKRVKYSSIPNWMSNEIRNEMKKRDQLKKNKKFEEYKKQRNKVSTLVKIAKRNYFEQLLNQPQTNNTAQTWKAMNEFTNKSRKKQNSNAQSFSADEFNDYFLSVTDSIIKSENYPLHYEYEPSEQLKDLCMHKLDATKSFAIPLMSKDNVIMFISKLNNKKTMDVNYLNSTILKMSLPYIVDVLTFIYNLSIMKCTYPSIFKQAKITPLQKTSDTTDLDNYRPISILSILSKPLEKHIHLNLMSYLEENKLLHLFQSGFRTKHSSHTALMRLYDTWLNAINNKEMVGAVFLDLRKAFDLVNHNILIRKLQLYLQNDESVSFFISYLSQRQQSVYANGSFSCFKNIKSGVPQGSILGPVLFCLYINDLPLCLSQPDAILDLFADDSTLHTSHNRLNEIQTTLQKSINDIVSWCTVNRMVLHPKKSKSMLITTRQKHQLYRLSLDLSIDSIPIEQVNNHRILGIILDNKLDWHPHIDSMCKKISCNLYLMAKLKLLVSTDALKLFFHAHILSYINNSSTLWCNASEIQIKRIDSLHKRGIKLLSNDSQLTTTEKCLKNHLLPLRQHLIYNGCMVMYKIYFEKSPSYLDILFQKARQGNRSYLYRLPLPRIDLFKSSLAFWGASIWNMLPLACKEAPSIPTFKNALYNYLVEQCL